MITWYTVPEIWHVTDVIVIFHFGLFFVKWKFQKKWKKHLEISSFYTCVPKILIRWCTVPEEWCMTDGRTDRLKKWHIEVGAPPKNKKIYFELLTWRLNFLFPFWATNSKPKNKKLHYELLTQSWKILSFSSSY